MLFVCPACKTRINSLNRVRIFLFSGFRCDLCFRDVGAYSDSDCSSTEGLKVISSSALVSYFLFSRQMHLFLATTSLLLVYKFFRFNRMHLRPETKTPGLKLMRLQGRVITTALASFFNPLVIIGSTLILSRFLRGSLAIPGIEISPGIILVIYIVHLSWVLIRITLAESLTYSSRQLIIMHSEASLFSLASLVLMQSFFER